MRKLNAKKSLDSRLASGNVTLPVSYALFSKSIKNLPDIAFQIQCQQLEKGVTKSLDDCAKWYYESFYVDPTIRQRYDFRLDATSKIKEKILSVPIRASKINIFPESGKTESDPVITKDTVTITLDDYGTFVFPVSFATFTKYLNREKLMRFLLSNENFEKEERAKLMTDANSSRLYLNEFYKKFYIFPNRRPNKSYFKEVALSVLKQLLKPACPIDELAKATMAKSSEQDKEKEKIECMQDDSTPPTTKKSTVVSFAVFENHVKNLYDIIWKLKLMDPEYMCRGFEDCAETFYLAFYQTPEIREKYSIELKNCTNAMRDKIFSIPSKDEANELDKQFGGGQRISANTQEFALNKKPQMNLRNNVKSIYSVEVDLGKPGRFIFPVSIDVFRSFINYEDIIEPLLRFNNNKDDSQESRIKCFKRYYNSFYVYAEKRNLVQYKFLHASDKMLEILLSFGQPLDQKAEKTIRSIYLAKDLPIANIAYPVTFKQFQKFIKNLNDIVQQMMKCGEFGYLQNPESRKCYEKEYYKLFYASPQIRKRFPYELAPCPAAIKTKLLKLPVNSSEAMINEEPVVRTINGLTYEYPVSLKTMVKYINYNELIKQLRDAHKKDQSLNGGPSYTDAQLIKKYYNFFYLNEEMRRMFKYNFDSASNKIREKLLAFARPIKANQNEENNNLNKTSINDTVIDCGKFGCFNFPVSIDIFKKYINYEEISNRFRLENTHGELELSKITDEMEDIMSCKNFRHYYLSFYIYPSIRDKYKYNFNCSESEMLEKLLSLAKPLNELATKTLQTYTSSSNKLNSCEAEKVNNFPVTFKTFARYIVNFSEIVNEMQLCDKYKDKTKEECYQEYYKEFYSSMDVRKKFEYKLKACPLKMKQKLLSFPVLPPAQVTSNTDDRCERDIILKIDKHGSFKYPVSFETFKSCINYAEICRALVSDSSIDKSLLTSPDNPKCQKMFRRYYYSFYVFPKIRKRYSYNFNCPDQQLLQKLSSYAQPLDEKAKQTIEGAFEFIAIEKKSDNVKENVELPMPAKEVSELVDQLNGKHKSRTLNEEETLQAKSDNVRENVELPVPAKEVSKAFDHFNDKHLSRPLNEEETRQATPSVSFKIFENLLYLDDVINQMQRDPEHAQLSREQCAMAYYHAFYYQPNIRDKYDCRMKPCPADLRIKLLAIPETRRIIDRDNSQNRCNKAKSVANLTSLHAARKAKFLSKTKIIFGIYNPVPPIIRKEDSPQTEAIDKLSTKEEEANKSDNTTNSGQKSANESVSPLNTEVTTNESVSPMNTAVTTLNVNTNAVNNAKNAAGSSMISNTMILPARTLALLPKIVSIVVLKKPKNTHTIPKQLKSGQEGNNVRSNNKTVERYTATPKDNSTAQQVATTSTSGTTSSLHNNQQSSALCDQNKCTKTSQEEKEAEKIFFSSTSNEHNMRYLLCSSHGLQKTIWRILSQLSLSEFKTYTNIHNGESFYENESMLSRCYAHVINKGNWPLNLYIKFSILHKLLNSKCVRHVNLQLGELSPKIFHWKELMLFTNFDEIAELMYWQRMKETIDNVETLWNERTLLYAMCWHHNKWIQKVPNITDRNIIECVAKSVIMPLDVERYRTPLFMEIDHSDNKTQKDSSDIAEAESEQQDHEISICPPTQLNMLNFVDVGSEQHNISQELETQNDPLLEKSISIPNVEITKLQSPLCIKQEPIKFLNHLRFTCNSNNSSDAFQCETISPDERTIVIDDEEDEALFKKLSCFGLKQKEDKSPLPTHLPSNNNSLENQITETSMHVELVAESSQALSKEISTTQAQDALQNLPPQIVVPGKRNVQKRRPEGKDKTTAKKPRLVTDYVPQVTHAFRALPLNAMVRVEVDSATYIDKGTDIAPQQQLQQLTGSQMTASQAFAIDDTLLKSSQLQDLLDPPNVARCKVNKDDISVNRAGLQPPSIQKSSTVIYRQLKSYIFIRSLTNAQTIEYGIDSLAVGQPYQRALVQTMKRNCYLNGPLLQTLFPHITSTVLVDLKFLIWAVEKYNWDIRNLCTEKNYDLRIRVLNLFMDVAPRFGHFRLKYLGDAFNWAACSLISTQDEEFVDRQPAFDMIKTIKPQILDQIKQFKKLP